MLQSIRQRLESLLDLETENPAGDEPQATACAAAALLIEVAKADAVVDDEEMQLIRSTLTEYFEISPQDIESTLDKAREELSQASCLFEMTRLINQNWDVRTKIRLIESMWTVILSDHRLDSNEQHLMRKLKSLLHISQTEFIAAKQRARNTVNSCGNADR